VGRQLQQDYGQPPQVVLTMPLLEGLDGTNKMSKSLGNYVGITEPPEEMFGKLMSISDTLMWRYFELLSFRPMAEIARLREEVAAGRNPRDVKFELGEELVARFHGGAAAGPAAREAFVRRFSGGELPSEIETVVVAAPEAGLGIANVLRAAQLATSNSDAFRLIDQGAVRIDGERVTDRGILLPVGSAHVYQVGKRRVCRIELRLADEKKLR
jgi:tyrosyl-tRNA synthetase